jgi:radical SAM superfamily enzyme YgiQ (UPF0313 family)
MKSPDNQIKCLLVYPEFSTFSFWNTKASIQTSGAKATTPPLGLLTVAALLPQHWHFRILDLNARSFDQEDWDWADLIATGGMLPQQRGLLDVIERAKKDQKFVIVGGPDATNQPDIYQQADARILNEGEITIPQWLASWRSGEPRGIFKTADRPDISKTPIPRYDLINMKDYYYMGVQYARGCPFNCEFCDIIELYGRKPRHKTPEQFIAELQNIYDLGFRGYIEIVDDNFIGNKRNVKRELLPAIIEWQNKFKKPFYFGTEASMNMADDLPLLQQMKEAEFKWVFMGIETPDPELLTMTQKSQNTIKPIAERVRTIYEYGIIVTAGFIIGFDNEKKHMDRAMIACIEETGICMAMVGLLVALPGTQLSRRLVKEKRLMNMEGKTLESSFINVEKYSQDTHQGMVDQTIAGLNYITTRDRLDILDEYAKIIRAIYEPKSYFERALRTAKSMKWRKSRRHHFWEQKRTLRALLVMCWRMTKDKKTRWLFWKTGCQAFMLGLHRYEVVMTILSIYMHFDQQSQNLLKILAKQKVAQANLPRSTQVAAQTSPPSEVSEVSEVAM